jgi:DNA-directed RNA polymerase III subunit RPC1
MLSSKVSKRLLDFRPIHLGLPSVHRCVIHADEKKGDTYQLLVEGTNYREVLATYEVNPNKTFFNNASGIAEVLGIEAARSAIISEIISTMKSHGIELDRRHVMLLADLMTYR